MGVDCVQLEEDMNKLQAVVNMVINTRVLLNAVKFCTSFQRRTLLHDICCHMYSFVTFM